MAKKPKNLITDEIATARNDIIQDYIGNVVLNPDKVLRSESGGKGIELYEDLMRDSEVQSALQTRKLAVVGKEWEIIPASDDAEDMKIAEFVKDVLKQCNYDAARQSLLSGIVLGYKPAEIMWEYSEGDIWIKEIIGKASRRFVFNLQGRPRLLTMQNMIEGIEVPDRKFVVFRNISDNGSYYGDGLGRSLYWPCWFRKNGIKFWAIFCDKFGSPTGVGKYPAGTIKAKQDDLLAAVTAIQQESGIIIPDNMIIELLEATRAGSINTYETFCAYNDKAINKVLLGHSAATESTPGKLGNEQQSIDIRQDYIKADADALCECQNNGLIRWIVDYNFPDTKAYPKVWIRTEPEKDLKPLAERDRILVKEIGLPVTKKYFYETYGIPQPEEGEELIEIPASTPTPNPSQEGNNAGGGMGGQQFAESVIGKLYPDQIALDKAVQSFSPEELQKQLEGILQPVIDMIQHGEDYNAILSKLAGTYPEMDQSALIDMLARAIFVTETWGKLNAMSPAGGGTGGGK